MSSTATTADRASAREDAAADLRGALDDAYRRHAPLVIRTLRRHGVEPAWLDDCAHEVFVVALRRWASREQADSLPSWLYGIARRVASTHRRGRARMVRRERAAPKARAEPSPEAYTEAQQRARFVEAFLDTLGDAQREVFVLSEIEGMSGPEIARALELETNTVYTRLARARRAFADAIAERGER